MTVKSITPLQASPNQRLQMSLRISNIGKTPSREIIGRFYVDIVSNGEAPDLCYNTKRPTYRALIGEMFPTDHVDTMPAIRQKVKGERPRKIGSFKTMDIKLSLKGRLM